MHERMYLVSDTDPSAAVVIENGTCRMHEAIVFCLSLMIASTRRFHPEMTDSHCYYEANS
jgi:hypothetical protein